MKRLTNLINHDQDKVLAFIAREDQPSTFEDYGDFRLLVLRRLSLVEDSISLWSEVFLFLPEKIYYFSRATDNFLLLNGGFEELFAMLTKFYESNQAIIVGYSDEIENLEDSLFERDISRNFMDTWFRIKKDLAKIENFYYRNLVVFREFEKSMVKEFPSGKVVLDDIHESIGFQNSSVVTLKSRLDSLHHYYDSIKQERLNKTIFTLTIISAVFLPMNLLVGFFGMNTQGLFFSEDPLGTMNVIYLLVGISFLTLGGLKLIKTADHYLLRYLLGKFDFYKRISKRFEEMEHRLKGD